MKQATDTKTPDLLGDTCDLAGPVPAKPTAQDKARERARRFREKNGLAAMTVNIDATILADFNDWYAKPKNKAKWPKKGDAIAHLIKTQLLRKR